MFPLHHHYVTDISCKPSSSHCHTDCFCGFCSMNFKQQKHMFACSLSRINIFLNIFVTKPHLSAYSGMTGHLPYNRKNFSDSKSGCLLIIPAQYSCSQLVQLFSQLLKNFNIEKANLLYYLYKFSFSTTARLTRILYSLQ